MPRTMWTCCGCEKSFEAKENAETCEKTHGPFIKLIDATDGHVGSRPHTYVFVPKFGDVIVTADAIAKAIDKGGLEWRRR